ncbi:MAG: hypothetical protein PHX51_04890 [Clostridia bacterium]|nr:hypothetical protein [Clostridia bacterium]
MELLSTYNEIKKRLDKVDFSMLWEGFSPFKFAVYNDERVVIEGEERAVGAEFIANTAIYLDGEYVAIWKLCEEIDLDVLTAKMVHEMFHAYQQANGDKRFPNEFDALVGYKYDARHIQFKLDENGIIARLFDKFDNGLFCEVFSRRLYRKTCFPLEYDYEAHIETIEGAAQCVEYFALKALNEKKAKDFSESMKKRICTVDLQIPARIISYDVGALLLIICKNNGIFFEEKTAVAPYLDFLTEKLGAEHCRSTSKAEESGESFGKLGKNHFSAFENVAVSPEVVNLCREDMEFVQRTCELAQKTYIKTDCDYPLKGYNVYSARFYEGFLISEYFVMYEVEGKDVCDFGNIVLKLQDGRVKTIYKQP